MNDLSKTFGSALFYRILLPGLVFAIGIHPLIASSEIRQHIEALYPGGPGALFLAEVVTSGLIAYVSAIPVHHVAQGLVFSPLTRLARSFNTWRFHRKYDEFAALYGNDTYDKVEDRTAQELQQLFIYLSDFPIERDEAGEARFGIRYSTRVGNIIATHERYTDTRYGINAEAFWDHFFQLMPSDTRKELDTTQAIAVGTVLSSAAGWTTCMVCLVFLLLRLFSGIWTAGKAPVSDGTFFGLALYGMGVAILFNYLSRVVYREYGRQFRAAIDTNIAKFTTWLNDHQAPIPLDVITRAETFRIHAKALSATTDEMDQFSQKQSATAKFMNRLTSIFVGRGK